jgi:hypothetical protein
MYVLTIAVGVVVLSTFQLFELDVAVGTLLAAGLE